MTPEQEAQLLSHAHMMRELRASQPWQALVGLLKVVESQLTEQLIQAPPNDVTRDTLRGEIFGIRRSLGYPDMVIQVAESIRAK